MVLRADGHFYLTDGAGLASTPAGRFLNTTTGAYLTTGGVWTNSSDRARKENFSPVDGQELLAQIAKLPILEWNYKTEGEAIRHIGPAAQDFFALFGLGMDDKTISTIDPAGLALAAIQELNKKSHRVDELEQRVEKLQALVEELMAERR